jgi:GNAT superfamily N-acetyltransferase
MSAAHLKQEIAAGVEFWAYVPDDAIAGVMGLQSMADVDLIRHAYVLPEYQGRGIGGHLLTYLRRRSGRRLLIGTWAAARDAIRFYEQHGFVLLTPADARPLLQLYWDISEAQIVDSVVLADSG